MAALVAFHLDVFRLKQNASARCKPSLDQVFDDFMLSVNGDGASGEIFEIDTMALSGEAKFDTVVNQAFALHPFAHAHLREQIDGARLEHACANAFLAILAGSVFEHDGVDALEVEQMREYQPGGTGSDNSNLRAYRVHPRFLSSIPFDEIRIVGARRIWR